MNYLNYRIINKDGRDLLESFWEDDNGIHSMFNSCESLKDVNLPLIGNIGETGISGTSGFVGASGVQGISGFTSSSGLGWIHEYKTNEINRNNRIYPTNIFSDEQHKEKEKIEQEYKYNALDDYFPTFT